MAKEFLLTGIDGLSEVSGYVVDHFDNGGGNLKLVITESSGSGKWGMARLWRKWMKETATHMANNGSVMPLMIDSNGEWYGKRRFNEKDAHELFTSQWLGLNEKGERLSWAKSDGVNIANKGQRFMAMIKHEQWCIEKGIMLSQPRNSELHELKEAENG